jgi:hypothetical protein
MDIEQFIAHTDYEIRERTKNRLLEILKIGMTEVGNAQFGVEGIMSGLYIEMVWSFSEEDWNGYIKWAKELIQAKTKPKEYMEIHKDLERIKTVVILQAIEHDCNYNLIIHNHVNEKFDPERSTYEMVVDSYFEKPRPNVVILHKTDTMLVNLEHYFDDGWVTFIKKKIQEKESLKALSSDMYRNPPLLITNPYPKEKENFSRPDPVVNEPKVNRNDKCPCGSGQKYKNCCLK